MGFFRPFLGNLILFYATITWGRCISRTFQQPLLVTQLNLILNRFERVDTDQQVFGNLPTFSRIQGFRILHPINLNEFNLTLQMSIASNFSDMRILVVLLVLSCLVLTTTHGRPNQSSTDKNRKVRTIIFMMNADEIRQPPGRLCDDTECRRDYECEDR